MHFGRVSKVIRQLAIVLFVLAAVFFISLAINSFDKVYSNLAGKEYQTEKIPLCESNQSTNFKASLGRTGVEYLSQDDIGRLIQGTADQSYKPLIDLIRTRYIYGPSKGPLNLLKKTQNDFSQVGQSKFVDNLLRNKTNGFYIECGGGTGERLSNSLYFERVRGWKGLLIEPNPDFFMSILKKKRNACLINTALCSGKATFIYKFYLAKEFSGVEKEMVEQWREAPSHIPVQCFHLFSILQAINQKHVDYFSLDIEGPELEVLKTIPFDRVFIGVLTVEFRIVGHKKKQAQKKNDITTFLESTGHFRFISNIQNLDLVFCNVQICK